MFLQTFSKFSFFFILLHARVGLSDCISIVSGLKKIEPNEYYAAFWFAIWAYYLYD